MDDHDRDPKHAPDEPTADQLPVEPEMDKGQEKFGDGALIALIRGRSPNPRFHSATR